MENAAARTIKNPMKPAEKISQIIDLLSKVYPHPKTSLHFINPLELLISTMLSAQATDTLVNTVTPALFSRYKNVKGFADAPLDELDTAIRRVNFHRNKAKNIQAACRMIIEQFNGSVPQTMEALDRLPGVARKTANVVLGNAFGKSEGIAVDTHVIRLSRKLGLTKEKDPVKIEKDLMKIVPRDQWIDVSHLLILHGRDHCPARPHSCIGCPLGDLCPCQSPGNDDRCYGSKLCRRTCPGYRSAHS